MPYKTKHLFVKIEMKQSKDIGTNTYLVSDGASASKTCNNFQMTPQPRGIFWYKVERNVMQSPAKNAPRPSCHLKVIKGFLIFAR